MKEQLKDNHLLHYFSYEDLEKIYKMDDLYLKAKIIVTEVFKDKFDKEGEPFVGHLLRVSDKLEEEEEKIAGLLHDILENTDVTSEDLFNIGFSGEILEIVQLVTKEKGSTKHLSKEERLCIYSNKIDSIISSGNIHAIRLKEADMSDNYDLNRLKNLPKEQQHWFHLKYGRQLEKLRKKLGK